MKVEVRLFATLARYLPEPSESGSATVEIPEGSTARQLVSVLGIPAGIPVVILVNGQDATPDQTLRDGDTLTLFPPLAGGSAAHFS